MRYLTMFGAVALTVALWSLGTSCAAQEYGQPGGTYIQTCQDVRTNGTTLEARCQTRDNNWNQTSLQNFNQCTGGIENIDGNLACNKPEYHQRGGEPNGAYVQTCQEIRTRGNRLEANCPTGNGDWNRASLQDFNLCTGEIVNENGRLRCNR